MKPVLFLFVMVSQIGFAQYVPHTANLTPLKSEVLSTEEFTVTYELSDMEGYIYVAIVENEFEIVGKKRWEGHIERGEKIVLQFTLRLRESFIPHVSKKVPITVMFNGSPFGDRVLDGVPTGTTVIIKDYETIQQQLKKKGRQHVGEGEEIPAYSVTRVPVEIFGPLTPAVIDPKNDAAPSIHQPGVKKRLEPKDSSAKLSRKVDLMEDHLPAGPESGYDITWSADGIHFYNAAAQRLPWQYYTVQILGRQFGGSLPGRIVRGNCLQL